MNKAKRSTLAEQLLAAIEGSGMSVRAIAAGSGLNQPTLSRFVNHTRDLSLTTGDKLAEFFSMRLTRPIKPKP